MSSGQAGGSLYFGCHPEVTSGCEPIRSLRTMRVHITHRIMGNRGTDNADTSPPELADELERVWKREHRTHSELVREALRR